MKYKFYGTAAAEAIPSLYCECDVCKRARSAGGRNLMSRSQSVVDDKILIDYSADTLMHVERGLDLNPIKTYIITHGHEDHFYPIDLSWRRVGFARHEDVKPIDIYAGSSACAQLEFYLTNKCKCTLSDVRITLHEVKPFVPFEAEGYKITPLRANHDPLSSPVFYIIEKDGKAILHANDTGYFFDDVWEYLKNNPVHLDFASFDCTSSALFPDNNECGAHMNYSTVLHVIENLKKIKMIDEKTICYINHFSHNGGCDYDDLCKMTEEDGISVSYDGCEVTF